METKIYHKGLTYKVVDSAPAGFLIWNIGKHAPNGYLPFCRLNMIQPFEGGRAIDVDSLMALPCEGADVILCAVPYGPQTSAEMENYIRKNAASKKKAYICERMERAIPYLKKINL